MNQCLATAARSTTADPVAEAYERIRAAYATATAQTVPDGWALERIGQCWSVGPTGTGTHLLVDGLWQVPGAIAAFEQQIARAAAPGFAAGPMNEPNQAVTS